MCKIAVRVFLLSLIPLSLWQISGCARGHTHDTDTDSLLTVMENGDLLFRRGMGFVGHVVTNADREGRYSHVGIVVAKDNTFYIVHAVPHEPDFEGDVDRVKCESVYKFIGRYPDASIGLYRLDVSDSLKAMASAYALLLSERCIPFDHDYNLEDDDALYCTELVELVYARAGVSVSEGRRTDFFFPGMAGSYIMPSDLTQCAKLRPIMCK